MFDPATLRETLTKISVRKDNQRKAMVLKGQIALVTGASRGIGQAIALELGRQGAQVIGTATSADGAEKISAALKEKGVDGKRHDAGREQRGVDRRRSVRNQKNPVARRQSW